MSLTIPLHKEKTIVCLVTTFTCVLCCTCLDRSFLESMHITHIIDRKFSQQKTSFSVRIIDCYVHCISCFVAFLIISQRKYFIFARDKGVHLKFTEFLIVDLRLLPANIAWQSNRALSAYIFV